MPDVSNQTSARAERSGEVGAILKRKIGPLPTYGWAIIAGGMLVGFFYLRRKNGGLQYADDSGAATEPGYAAGGYGVGSGAASGGGASPFFPTPPTNSDSPTLPPATQPPVTTPPVTPPPTAINPPASTPPPAQPTFTGWVETPKLRDMPGYNPVIETPSNPALDYTPAPDYYTVTDVNGRVWNIPKGQPVPSYIDLGAAKAPTATVPAAPAAPINIPQTWLSPGAWNEITSPGGTITGLQGWSAWDYLGDGQWQQWNEGEYSAPGSTLGLLPVGMSLPGGRTARAA